MENNTCDPGGDLWAFLMVLAAGAAVSLELFWHIDKTKV
jgi:hypothetical protein